MQEAAWGRGGWRGRGLGRVWGEEGRRVLLLETSVQLCISSLPACCLTQGVPHSACCTKEGLEEKGGRPGTCSVR